VRGPLGSLEPARALWLVAFGAALVLAATLLPAISLANGSGPDTATRSHAEPVALTRSICPGPQTLGIEGLADTPAQTVSVLAVGAPDAAWPAGFDPGQRAGSITISGLPPGGRWAAPVTAGGQVVSAQVSTARSALVTGAGSMAPGTVATQWSWTRTGTARGLTTTACTPAATSSWLVAGGAEPGRLEHLVLANPGPNPVTVDLLVFGAKGPISSPNGQGLVVAGRSRIVILLDAVAGSEPSPVVHVTARGGKVAAVLSDTWLDGVIPRGGDDAVSVTAPSRQQVIAAVPIDGRALLRVAAAGDSEAIVQSRVLTPRGPMSLPADGVTRVAAGTTRDIDLGSLPPGAYAVQVQADVPVFAAAMVERRRAAGAPSDLAWAVASEPISVLAGMALPAAATKGLTQRLDLVAAGHPSSVQVTTVAADGVVSTKKVVIAADSVSTLPLDGAASVWVTPLTGLVRGGVLTTATDPGGAMLSVTPLSDLTLNTTLSPLRQLRD
jgi:hypothetical protein